MASTSKSTKSSPSKDTTKAPRKPNPSFMKEMKPSPELAAVVGEKPLSRPEVVKRMWAYIKEHKLQDPKEKRNINADDKLRRIFGGKGTVTMFEMPKYVNQHLKD